MGILTNIAIFFVLWWIVLFTVLPFGVRGQWEDNDTKPGTDPGAPVHAPMMKKFIITTIVTAIVFAVFRVALFLGVFDSMIGL